MADIHNNKPTKRGFSFPGDDACHRLVTSADTDEDHEEEMPPVKKMRHQSKEATNVVNELFSPETIHSPGPLGLNLTKSPSFLELIQKKLALAAKVKRKQATENVACRGAIRSKSTATEGMKPSQKLQASKFQASVLRIGDWEVSVEPQFFKETSPRPYKSTSWHTTTDFTGGQARNLRHVLQCDPGIMDKHIANLLSGDHRLYLLSQENNINPESPFPGTCCSVPEIPLSWSHENSYGSDDDSLTEQTGESFSLHPMPMGTMAVRLNHYGALQLVHSPSSEEPTGGSDQLKGNKFNRKKFFEKTAVVQQPLMSSGGIMNGKGNHINNMVNSENSRSRLNYSSPPPEVIRMFPGDSMTNRQVEPPSQSSRADHADLYPSSEEPSVLRAPLKKDMFDWKNIFQIPRGTQYSMSNAGIMKNDSGYPSNSLINSQDLSCDADYSSLPGEMTTWRIPDDRKTNHQINLWNQPSYNHGLSNQNMVEQGAPQCDFSGSQTLLQNPSSYGSISPERMTLEQISQNLLSDDGVINAVEKENLLSAVNSFSCLIRQAPHPLSQSSHSQASNTRTAPTPAVEPTEVIDVDASESSGADDWLLPRMESPSSSWELSLEHMAELLPYS